MNVRLITRTFLILAACAGPAMAQATVDQSINASVTLITALSWSAVTGMDFGTVSIPTTGNAVVVLPSNSTTRSISGGNGQLVGGTSGVVNGAATLTSEPSTALTLSVGTITPPVAVNVLLSAVKVNGSSLTNAVLGSNSITSDGSGTDAFTFGGTLTITTAATTGVKTGSFIVTAIYN